MLRRLLGLALSILLIVGTSELLANETCRTLAEALPFLLTDYQPYEYGKGKGAKVGIEIEGTVFSKYTRKQVGEGLKKRLEELTTENNWGITDVSVKAIEGHWNNTDYQLEYTRNQEVYKFTIQRDPSIRVTEGEAPVEIASPILRDKTDRDIFMDLVEFMKNRFGFQAHPVSSGLHVHVDFSGATTAEIATMEMVFASIEAAVTEKFVPTEERSKWAKSLKDDKGRPWRGAHCNNCGGWHPDRILSKMEEYVNNARKSLGTENGHEYKYTALNWQTLGRIGTVEFRFFNASVDLVVVARIADFCQRLVRAVRSQDARLMTLLKDPPDGVVKFEDIAKALNMQISGKEADTTRRILDEIAREREVFLGKEPVKNNNDFQLSNAPVQSAPAAQQRGDLVPLLHLMAMIPGMVARALEGSRSAAAQ